MKDRLKLPFRFDPARLLQDYLLLEQSDWIEDGKMRLHIVVTTNPDVDFRLNGERVIMNEGECWYLRLSDPNLDKI